MLLHVASTDGQAPDSFVRLPLTVPPGIGTWGCGTRARHTVSKVMEGPRLQGRSKTISTGAAAARLRHLALHLALRWDLRGVNLHFIA
jgi:hypothetical protein